MRIRTPWPSRLDPRPLLLLAALLAVAAFVYQGRVRGADPAEYRVRKGNYRLQDGRWEEAVAEFDRALAADPEHVYARLGRATALLQLGRPDDALAGLDDLLAGHPELAPAHAERGILLDRVGRHEEALAAYRRALALDPDGFEGPGFLWRFLHNVAEKPPTIRQRADYLEAELGKPPDERLLSLPEEDARQTLTPSG